jgi:glycosyltransferase involved in cell wall biosynthesis
MMIPRIAILVDLPREAAAGGHVKYWERLAEAAVKENAPVDLTIYFSGTGEDKILSARVRYRYLPPVFSTARLKFLPYVPAHTDLAPFHFKLAEELPHYDVIQTTDGYFAFARTAERVARWEGIPLVTAFHTDTPAYAEVFTHETLQNILGNRFGARVDGIFRISARQRTSKEKRLKTHLRGCSAVLAMRPEDIALAQGIVAADAIKPMRLGVDKDLFAPQPGARVEIEHDYKIATGKFLVLFVGRVDAGKNVPRLVLACDEAIKKGANLHLVVVGQGPMSGEVKAILGDHVTLTGILPPEKLAQFYAAADCLAMASDIEIGGMIGLEALACGCPVLTSKSSGVAHLCGEPTVMQEVESNVAAWTEALTSLAQYPKRQATMRAAALSIRHDRLAGWNDVLNNYFIPVWNGVRTKPHGSSVALFERMVFNVRQTHSGSGRAS